MSLRRKVVLTEAQRAALERLLVARKTPQGVACRARIVLMSAGKSGVLNTRHTRAAFLADTTHRVRFVYTPKHSSWLNQVEIWFSVLSRRLLRRSSFKSLDELRRAIEKFIAYFNEVLAKPYRWTYRGRVCSSGAP